MVVRYQDRGRELGMVNRLQQVGWEFESRCAPIAPSSDLCSGAGCRGVTGRLAVRQPPAATDARDRRPQQR